MTIIHTPAMRKALAGISLIGALSLPLGGIAAAESGAEGRVPTTTRATTSTRVPTSSTRPPVKVETTAPQPDKGAPDGTRGGAQATPAGLKEECTAQITRRLGSLSELSAAVAAKGDALTSAHRSAIDAVIANTTTGLTALKAEVDAATTVDALKPLCRKVVTDFRVYALVVPQVNLVLAADAVAAKQQTFVTLRTTLAEAIAKGRTPANGAELDAMLASFDGHVAAMFAAVDGVANRALGITVAAYNADPKVLTRELDAMRTAHTEAKAAARDAHRILERLGAAGAESSRTTQASGTRDASKTGSSADSDERPPASGPTGESKERPPTSAPRTTRG